MQLCLSAVLVRVVGALCRGQTVLDGPFVLGVDVLVGMGLALVVAVRSLDLGLLGVALVAGLVDLGVADVGVHGARHCVCFAARVLLKLDVWRESESWSIAHEQNLCVVVFDDVVER